MEKRKPLDGKCYGSIPHIPGSRLGPGDHHCHEGQARIATEKTRDVHDLVIVTEKLDGSNVGVARIDGAVYPLTRAGYLASTSPYEQHWRFGEWVYANQDRFLNVLKDGERICGEWLMQAHGTRYNLFHEPFVAFDLMRGKERASYQEFTSRVAKFAWNPRAGAPWIEPDDDPKFVIAANIYMGPAVSVEKIMEKLTRDAPPFSSMKPSPYYGYHQALDPVEGAVWRVERDGIYDFMVKYVRPDKVDGCYLPEVSGKESIFNWRPSNEVSEMQQQES